MNVAGGFVIACIAPVLFYLYIFGALKKGNSLSEIKTLKKTDWLFSSIILFGITGVICILIKQNHFIYYWDYGREWTTAISVSHDLFEAPLSALKGIYHSINEEDYNRFMPILIALPLKLLGNSFARYVVINQVFYMCPALFMISLLAYKILRKFQIVRTKFWNVLLFVAATPIIYYVLLDGFMDPPVLLLISGVLMLSLDFDFRRMDISRCVLIAIGLLLLVLFRRHFAYWVVGYVFSILFVAIYQFINNKEDRKIIFKNYVTDMFVIGGISLAVLLTAFNRFLMRSVFNNFYYAYKAYDVSYADKFGRILIVFGWGILFMAIVLAPLMCRFYKGLVAVIATYFINIALATFLLWRELQMNWHQYYLIVIQVMIMACIGLFGLAERLEKKKGNVLAAVGMVWGIAGMVICYVPAFNGVNICNLFSTRYYEAKVRNDLEEVNSLIECVNSLANESNGKRVYVVSSSQILNSDTLKKARLPLDNNPVPNLYDTKNVDLRDGFPVEMFYADLYKEKADGYAVAEGGVFQGEFAKEINACFPECKLYLFDTFEGFDSRDTVKEHEEGLSVFDGGHLADTSVDMVLGKLPYREKAVVRAGYFPMTTEGLEDEKFFFVNLDFDLYNPTLEGLRFFYPRLAENGLILIHDYYNPGYGGIKKAIGDYEKESGTLRKFPIGDHCSIAILKSLSF